MQDKTGFANILRIVYNNKLFSTNDWRPGYEQQKINAHIYWSLHHKGRDWLEDKAQIINKLIQLNGYTSYLEIGGLPWDERSTYLKVQCNLKHTVDPLKNEGDFERHPGDVGTHFGLKSDDFFANNPENKYDIVFIDGYHEHQQVKRDIENSLHALKEGGIIFLHDMIPLTRDLEIGASNAGTCWRAFADLRASREDLEMHTLVPPWGTEDSLGIVRFGKQKLLQNTGEYSYEYLLRNLEDIMLPIDLDTFYNIYIPPKNEI